MKTSHKTRSIVASLIYYKMYTRKPDIINEPYDYKCFNVLNAPMWPAAQDRPDTYLGYVVHETQTQNLFYQCQCNIGQYMRK